MKKVCGRKMTTSIILDSDAIPSGISHSLVRLPNEESSDHLARATHLHMQDRRVRQIGDLSAVRNLSVLYLYDNRIQKIERLDAVPGLKMLYLQRNQIEKIENIGHLTALRKLYLSGNKIRVIEGLEKLKNLKELHVDRQNLEPNQNLVFDPRTCKSISLSLTTLNASHNQMLLLSPIQDLKSLSHLDVSGNLLQDIDQEVAPSFSQMTSLHSVDFRGNPLCKQLRYWEKLVAISPANVKFLDGRAVSSTCRGMIKAMSSKTSRSNKRKNS